MRDFVINSVFYFFYVFRNNRLDILIIRNSMKDKILIFLYEAKCVLKDLATVFCALFGIKLKNSEHVGWLDKLLMLILLIIYSVLIFIFVKFDNIMSIL